MFNGSHVGDTAITQYVIDYSPKIVLSGHVHESGPLGNNPKNIQGLGTYDNPVTGKSTAIINPGNLGRFGSLNLPDLTVGQAYDYGTFVKLLIEQDGTPVNVEQYTLKDENGLPRKVRSLREYDWK